MHDPKSVRRRAPDVLSAGDPQEIRLRLPPDAGPQIRVTVETSPADGHASSLYTALVPLHQAPGRVELAADRSAKPHQWVEWWRTVRDRLRVGAIARKLPLDSSLAAIAVVVYLATRLWAIDTFPVFFYSDEANNVWFGEQALQHGLLGEDGSWPAVYFPWDSNRWTPALTVYVYGLTAAVFGKSIVVARSTGAFITLAGVLAVAWILKDHFRSRFWWASILLAACIPTWFLYSRTVFDAVAATSLYAIFLFAYLRYRFRSPGYLGLAAIAGAAAFYSYSNMQAIIAALAACLLVSDLRYHVSNSRTWLRVSPLLVLLAVPLMEFRILHPTAVTENLSAIGSYWMEGLSFSAKLGRYALNYLHGLNPIYWFAPQNGESEILPDQSIPGAGHLGILMLPLVALGLIVALRNLRSPLHRLLLFSVLVVPVGGALDTIEITRVLAMVIPALILAVVGLDLLASRLTAIPRVLQTAFVAVVLAALGIARLTGALANGPTWSSDYGLGGSQFGAKAVFQDAIPQLLAEDPARVVIMTTTWANNVDQYPRFFLSQEMQLRVKFGNVRDYLSTRLELNPGMVIVMTPPEFADAQASPVLASIDVLKTILAPDGKPAFYFARLTYVEDVDRVLEQVYASQQQLVEDIVDLKGQTVQILHSRLGDGLPANMFDGDPGSLVRGDRVNPFEVELRFTQPILLSGVSLTTGSMGDFSVDLQVFTSPDAEPWSVSQRYTGLPADPTVSLELPTPAPSVSVLRLQITDHTAGREAQIHVREIDLRMP
jgi:4-amino-4-deoxy-L-arabinose transferase-like glycosyltransferase